MLWRAEKPASTAEAGKEIRLRRLQTRCHGRSGSLASTWGGGGSHGPAQHIKGHTGEAEDLEEEGPLLLEESWDGLGMWPPREAGKGHDKGRGRSSRQGCWME